MDKTQKKKIVSVNFSHALFFVLDFLILEKVGMIGCPKMSGRNYEGWNFNTGNYLLCTTDTK